MTIVELPEIIASHGELFNFGSERIQQNIAAGQIARIPIAVGHNKIRVIYEYKFGNITVNVLNFRWDNIRNAIERNLLLGTEQINFPVRPFPFLIVKEGNGFVVVQNTAATAQVFEMTIEYFETIKEFIERLEKYLKWKDIVR